MGSDRKYFSDLNIFSSILSVKTLFYAALKSKYKFVSMPGKYGWQRSQQILDEGINFLFVVKSDLFTDRQKNLKKNIFSLRILVDAPLEIYVSWL